MTAPWTGYILKRLGMGRYKPGTAAKYAFVAPAVLYAVVMIIAPLVYTFALGFHEWSMSGVEKPVFVGLKNYSSLVADERFIMAILRTFMFAFLALPFELVLGVAVALLLNRDFIGKNFVKTMFLLPMVATPVSVGLVWMLIYEPTIGIANTFINALGIKALPIWLGSPKTAMLSLAIVDIWQWTPMISLIVLAGLSAMPQEPLESAKVDGATAWQTLFRVVLPMLAPTISAAMLLRLIDVLKTFDIIYSTTKGGPNFATETLNIFAFTQAFQYFTLGSASAVLVVFFAIVLATSVAFILVRNKFRLEL